ncbi:MAG: hypothetical protein ACE5KX_02855 [Acidimicrobiia bacterium]
MDGQPPEFPDLPEGEEPFPTSPGDEERPAQEPLPGEPPPGPPYRPSETSPWLVGLAVGVVLVAVSLIGFSLLRRDADNGATGPTEPPLDTAATSTTAPPDTTPADTTLPIGEAPPITPVGEPIPLDDLTMSSDDIGPLDFGADGDEALGKLVATFGQPTDDTGFITATGSFGACPGDSVRIVRWGPLAAVIQGDASASTFVSYRLDLNYGGLEFPTTDLATLSGLRAGDTVDQLGDIYASFKIEYVVDPDVNLTFELRSASSGALLLWGPVTSEAPDGIVRGIYSPNSCQG